MSNLAFVFPGQGAQKVGMGKDFYDHYDVAKQMFKEAEDFLWTYEGTAAAEMED